ncbi:hypothetical protein, partial [Escherichia coli]|uniref:hypothetical protein n=1 Tax=Escherichia coli TaxID=562 RepID=UPI001175C094
MNAVCTALLAGLLAAQAAAQTTPDAGQLMQQNQRNKAADLPRKGSGAELAAPVATLNMAGGATVAVKGFRFQGNT